MYCNTVRYTTDTMELDHDFIRSLRRFVVQVLKRRAASAAKEDSFPLDGQTVACTATYLLNKLNAAKLATVRFSRTQLA